MKLCAKLKWLYQRNGKPYRTISKHMGYSAQSIANWCNGNVVPGIMALKCVADYFNISLSELLEGVDKKL